MASAPTERLPPSHSTVNSKAQAKSIIFVLGGYNWHPHMAYKHAAASLKEDLAVEKEQIVQK